MEAVRLVWLLVTSAVCGATVMAVELLGARMLSVGYGGSMTVWAAMISVTLLSLALGYFAGGRVADRWPRPRLLYAAPLAAAAWIAVCPHARFVLKACYDRLGIQWGALASSAILFLPPLGLLGMIGPFTIRLLARGDRKLGSTAGGVYAVSTVGSVAGTLLTALWLIPSCGTALSFRVSAVAAGLTGAIGLLLSRPARSLPALLLPLLLAAVPLPGARVGARFTAPDGDTVVVKAVRESPHGRIVVLDKGAYRLLVVNGIVQSGVPRDFSRIEKGHFLLNRYFQELLPYMVEDPKKAAALIIGLAGGTTASILHAYEMEVECVDLDPAVIRTAREWFGFQGPAVAGDGRQFLEDCARRYDFCVIDAYSGDVFPFYLASVEAFRAARRVLRPGGVLALNFIGSPVGRAFASVYRTLETVFPNVLAVKAERSDDVQTITVFASARPIEFNRGWMDHLGAFTGVDPVSQSLARLAVRADTRGAMVLTDDCNPLDFIRSAEALRWRRRAAENIGEQLLF
jgi:spermidine synthase